MAKIKYLLQGISEDSHLKLMEEILSISNIEKVVFSVAFMKTKGLQLIEESLHPYLNVTDVFVGIRNGVTSIQAIMKLIESGIHPYLVDTGTIAYIFHPKIFLAYSNSEAKVIIGSANATAGGLSNNIEASTLLHLDRNNNDDEKLLNEILESLHTLTSEYPNNVIQVDSIKKAVGIFHEGRLFDERVSPNPSSLKSTSKNPESVPRMLLKTRRVRTPSASTRKPNIKRIASHATISKTHKWILLWESGELTERDLNIPSGNTTNPTGSMYLKKGNMENIDQRHYFREVIFSDLRWKRDVRPTKRHLERASAKFEIIVKGISYGLFDLKISHNTLTDTTTYMQNNSVTQIHWGDAKRIIANRVLLGQILRIYKPENQDSYFIIEID